MIKDNWFRIVCLGLSCHLRISDINISYFPFNITPFSECNFYCQQIPHGACMYYKDITNPSAYKMFVSSFDISIILLWGYQFAGQISWSAEQQGT